MGKNTTNDMTQGTACVLLVQFFSADPGRKSVSAVIQLCRLYGGGKRNWRYGTCSSRKYRFRTFSDHWFRNWADRRIGNLYFSVFWKWQL